MFHSSLLSFKPFINNSLLYITYIKSLVYCYDNNQIHTWKIMQQLKRLMPLIIIVFGLTLFFAFDGQKYVSLDSVKEHYQQLQNLVLEHFWISLFGFMLGYIVVVALAIPAAAPLMTLLGSSLFGWMVGTASVVVAATIGACVIFIAVKTAFGESLRSRVGDNIEKFRKGFENNAFNYLMTLRLIPIFPFFAINIACGVLGIRLSTYFWATLIGIIPGTAVYAWVGTGLGFVIEQGKNLDMSIVSEPQFILPIICLGLLSLVPTVYKKVKRAKQ